jgi:hypothetical protein
MYPKLRVHLSAVVISILDATIHVRRGSWPAETWIPAPVVFSSRLPDLISSPLCVCDTTPESFDLDLEHLEQATLDRAVYTVRNTHSTLLRRHRRKSELNALFIREGSRRRRSSPSPRARARADIVVCCPQIHFIVSILGSGFYGKVFSS